MASQEYDPNTHWKDPYFVSKFVIGFALKIFIFFGYISLAYMIAKIGYEERHPWVGLAMASSVLTMGRAGEMFFQSWYILKLLRPHLPIWRQIDE